MPTQKIRETLSQELGQKKAAYVPFNEKELEVVGSYTFFPGFPPIPIYKQPVSSKENFIRGYLWDGPNWIPMGMDIQNFRPRIFPDNVVCGLVVDGEAPLSPAEFSGKGWFDTEWVYIEQAQGAIVKPGKPQLLDANDWEKVLRFPNIDAYDWEGSAKANEAFIDHNRMVEVGMLCGFYERLIALMDVANAVTALIDEDQKDAVHALFDRLCVFYDGVIEKLHQYYHPDIILWHDDWGHQNSSFFSPETHEEMIVPYIARLAESCHKRGMLYEQHSCGKIENLVPGMIKAGIDIWQGQDMNDKAMLVDKYGKDIYIGVTVPMLPPGTSEEEQYKNAEAFVNQYKGKRIIAGAMPFDKTMEYTYKLGRISAAF